MFLITAFMINVTFLQGCNYAPIGEPCAPQFDMPHWYNGEYKGYTRSYIVSINDSCYYGNNLYNEYYGSDILIKYCKGTTWKEYKPVLIRYWNSSFTVGEAAIYQIHPYFINEPYFPYPNFVFRNESWIKHEGVQ